MVIGEWVLQMFLKIFVLEPPKTYLFGEMLIRQTHNAMFYTKFLYKVNDIYKESNEIDYCNGSHTRDSNTICGAHNPIHLFKNGKFSA